MARTNIDIDEKIMKKALALTGASSKREVVDIALKRLVQQENAYEMIRKARGKLEWEGDIDAWRRTRADRRDRR
jgi:Arc/MetJ family transcription regulator